MIRAVLESTRLPPASSMRTIGWVPSAAPLTPPTGWRVIVSFVAAPSVASAGIGAPRDAAMRSDPTAAAMRDRRVERAWISGMQGARFVYRSTRPAQVRARESSPDPPLDARPQGRLAQRAPARRAQQHPAGYNPTPLSAYGSGACDARVQ